MKNFLSLILVLLATWNTTFWAGAADWGSLKGRLVFDGTPEEPKPINVNKDTEYCSQHKLVEETLVVGEKGGINNAFVYLYVKKGKSVEVHPDLATPSEKPAVLDNKGCRFEPRAMVVRTTQPFEIRNSDQGVGHNTNAQTLRSNPKFNEQVSNDSPITKVFAKSESYPAEVACNVHPWMKSFILIRDNPYMAVTDAKGNFEIKNLPAGKHEFIFWHEARGNMRDLAVGDTKTSRKGRAALTITASQTLDLGEIKVPAAVLGL
ncbi:MAG: hypothetical protein MI725_00325 [Pirellulales bacterium]|nr:hypothetical protein [Pirellulales bacterium]